METCPGCHRQYKNKGVLGAHIRKKPECKAAVDGVHSDRSSEPVRKVSSQASPQEELPMVQQHVGCLDCVRKDNQIDLKDRDLRDVQEKLNRDLTDTREEREFYQKQAQDYAAQVEQWRTEAQRRAQEAQAAQHEVEQARAEGHKTLESLKACPNCRPTPEQVKDLAEEYYPDLFQPVTLEL